jgi:hypothetical protein
MKITEATPQQRNNAPFVTHMTARNIGKGYAETLILIAYYLPDGDVLEGTSEEFGAVFDIHERSFRNHVKALSRAGCLLYTKPEYGLYKIIRISQTEEELNTLVDCWNFIPDEIKKRDALDFVTSAFLSKWKEFSESGGEWKEFSTLEEEAPEAKRKEFSETPQNGRNFPSSDEEEQGEEWKEFSESGGEWKEFSNSDGERRKEFSVTPIERKKISESGGKRKEFSESDPPVVVINHDHVFKRQFSKDKKQQQQASEPQNGDSAQGFASNDFSERQKLALNALRSVRVGRNAQREFIRDHDPQRILDVVAAAKVDATVKNKAGYVCKALREGWEITVPKSEPEKRQEKWAGWEQQNAQATERLHQAVVAAADQSGNGNGGESAKIWRGVLGELELQMTRATFDTWLRDTNCLGREDNGDGETLIIGVKNGYAVEWLEHRLYTVIQRTLHRVVGQHTEARFVVWDEEAQEVTEPALEPVTGGVG